MTDKQQFCDTYVDLKKRVSRQKATNRKKLVAFALPIIRKESDCRTSLAILPVQQLFQNKSFHKQSPHIFIGIFVAVITFLLYAISYQNTTPIHKIITILRHNNHIII